MNPEILPGLTEAEYNARDAARSSFLWAMHDRSPAHALCASEESDALDFGTALHAYMLNSAMAFEAQVAIQPESIARRAGKEWEAFKAEAGDRLILKRDAMTAIERMAEAAARHETAAWLLDCDHDQKELSLFWTDDETGVRCKVRLDAFRAGWIADIKTTQDARGRPFAASAVRYGYHFRSAFYLAGARACGLEPEAFAWIAMEKAPPFGVAVYTTRPGDEWNLAGNQIMRAALRRYAACKASGVWPGYEQPDDKDFSLPFPKWAANEADL